MLKRLQLANPPSRFDATTRSYDEGEAPAQTVTVLEDQSRSILSENSSPDLPFRYSLNAYRGCAHGCSYCYARPSHEYLGFGAGTDFERVLFAKPQAARLLREAFERPSWRGDLIAISGNTDAYQPLEASHKLTQQCLEVCLEFRNPVHIITKSALVERDLDLLCQLHERASVGVSVSVTSLDDNVSRRLEPYAPTPERRLRTIARLAERGLPVMVHFAPWIPGLTDSDLVPVLEQARAAGAISAMTQPVRLPGNTASVFAERLARDFPLRAAKVEAAIRDLRGGRWNDPRFHARMRGEGAYATTMATLFAATCRRLGYLPFPAPKASFRRPPITSPQLQLFEKL